MQLEILFHCSLASINLMDQIEDDPIDLSSRTYWKMSRTGNESRKIKFLTRKVKRLRVVRRLLSSERVVLCLSSGSCRNAHLTHLREEALTSRLRQTRQNPALFPTKKLSNPRYLSFRCHSAAGRLSRPRQAGSRCSAREQVPQRLYREFQKIARAFRESPSSRRTRSRSLASN